jgi:hypothetical protein
MADRLICSRATVEAPSRGRRFRSQRSELETTPTIVRAQGLRAPMILSKGSLLAVLRSKRLAYGLVACFVVAACVLNYPGHLSLDSLTQLNEGRSGRFTSLNPPFASALLGLFDRIHEGAGLQMLFDIGLLALALIVMLRALPRTSALSNLLLFVFLASPITLIYGGIIWKDVLFAHLELLAFALLMSAERHSGRWKAGAIVVLLAASSQIRPQGVVVALVACMAFAWLPRRAGDRSVTTKAGLGIALFSATVIVSLLLSAFVTQKSDRTIGIAYSNAAPVLMLYDIAGIVKRVPDLDLSLLAQAGTDVPLLKQLIVVGYTPQRVDSLDIYAALPDSEHLYLPLVRQWVQAISTNPGAYLAHRFDVFSWHLGLHDPAKCLPVHVGIDDSDPTLLAALNLRETASPYSGVLWEYASAMFATPVFRGITYAAILGASLLLLARAGFGRHIAATSLALAALLFALSYLVLGIACDVRYLYFTLTAAMFCAVYATAHWQKPNRG